MVDESYDAEDEHEESEDAHSDYVRSDFTAGVLGDDLSTFDFHTNKEDQT